MKEFAGQVIDVAVNVNAGAGVEVESIGHIPLPTDTLEVNTEDDIIQTASTEVAINEDGEYDVAELVTTGPRGVTNQGMIPALKKFIDASNRKALETLKKVFPEVVDSSLKYLGKKEQNKFKEILQ